MNKLALSSIAALIFAAMVVQAASAPLPTVVNGHVFANDGKTVMQGIEVNVACNGLLKSDLTNTQGLYQVVFEPEECALGDEITVNAGGSVYAGTLEKSTNTVNLIFFDIQIPEFGLAAALLAAAGGVAVYLKVRRS